MVNIGVKWLKKNCCRGFDTKIIKCNDEMEYVFYLLK